MFSKHLKVAVRFTLITTVLFGLVYPLLMTGYASVVSRGRAAGQLVTVNGKVVGSAIIGQSFSSARYFHGRPSEAGNGYDAASSGGSNLALSSSKLVARIAGDVQKSSSDQPGTPVPAELVEASGSGLDPEISPASAFFQVDRVAAARHLDAAWLRKLVAQHVQGRQFGFLGEPRVNVLALNLALDRIAPAR